MESTISNNQSLFLSEFKELRKELSAVTKRIVHLEESHEKQQERIDNLEKENHALKTQLNINSNKEVGSTLKKKDKVEKEENESKSTSVSTSVSAGKKKTKTNDNNNDDEAVVIPRLDNGDSFNSLSDDLLHKIVEFDGNCYAKFGLINKRCRKIYDVKEYKLTKETCVFGCGAVDMMLQRYLQKRKKRSLDIAAEKRKIYDAVIRYNRLDALDWIIQLGDSELLRWVCWTAANFGRITILSKVFCKCNLRMLDDLLLSDTGLCYNAAMKGQLETLKWLRKYGAKWDSYTFDSARFGEYDEIIQYLRAEGCPESPDDTDESSVSEQDSSDDEDGDY